MARDEEIAVFGGGCFWCMEAIYQDVEGILEVQSGYSGGTVANPSYKMVCTGNTGHAEVVRLRFDPSVIKYPELLEIFFSVHDPTTLNRQGNDMGNQYRSIILCTTPEQRRYATDYIEKLQKDGTFKDKIVTEIVDFAEFYPAEDYHNNYYNENRMQPYCQLVIGPKLAKFRKKYKKVHN